MISELAFESSGPGSSPGILCCVLGQDIQLYKWVAGEFNAGGNPGMD